MDRRLYEVNGVRRFGNSKFGDASIQASIDAMLANVDPKAKAVIFDMGVDGEGVEAVAAYQTGNGFSVGVIGKLDRDKDWRVGVRLTKVWK